MSQPPAPKRRAAALAVNLLVLGAGLAGTFVFGLSVLTTSLLLALLATWVVLIGPLYFALYHGRGSAQTPGEREAGIAPP